MEDKFLILGKQFIIIETKYYFGMSKNSPQIFKNIRNRIEIDIKHH